VEELRRLIRDIPDFPRPGITFKDATPLLADPAALGTAIEALTEHARPLAVDLVVAPEARGFILAPAIARGCGAGFVPVRKPGKLPWKTAAEEYALEYGKDRLEIHVDALARGERVLIVDDLLATGGTSRATADLVKRLGGDLLGLAFLIELVALNGRERLTGESIHTVLKY
jgi:adenine phosphoribosyltransferase